MKTRIINYLIIFLALGSIATNCNPEKEESKIGITGDFTITPETGSTTTVFTFDASNYYHYVDIYENYDVNIRWDFDYTGEGNTEWDRDFSTQDTVTHKYTVAKEYTVRTEVHMSGTFLISSKALIVTNPNNTPPIASFTVGGSPGYPYIYLFSFDGRLCEDEEDPYDSLKVRWDWENDGEYDTEFSIYQLRDHVYNYTGEVEVKMQVKDTDGLLDETTRSVTILGPGGEPCPGIDSVDHGGYSYTTVQIGDQCWLNENLKIGTMIQSNTMPSQNTPNEIIEKYCYDNEPDSCEKYGGLYNWNEMMQYVEIEGAQGICPGSWHIPTDEEWKQLEGAIDGLYNYPDPEWDEISEYRGQDIGWNIKSQTYWPIGAGGYDKFGFGVRPGGRRYSGGNTEHLLMRGYFWTSTKLDDNQIWYRMLSGNALSGREYDHKTMGYSVRCLKND